MPSATPGGPPSCPCRTVAAATRSIGSPCPVREGADAVCFIGRERESRERERDFLEEKEKDVMDIFDYFLANYIFSMRLFLDPLANV